MSTVVACQSSRPTLARVCRIAAFLLTLALVTGCRMRDYRFIGADLLDGTTQGQADFADSREARFQRLASADPLAFLSECLDHYDAQVQDYRCHFLARERLDGQLGEEQEMVVLFREEPFSVDVRWIRNAQQAARVNFVSGRWERGDRQYAHIEPAGLLKFIAPQGVRRNIHAPDVRAAARRPIDQFGFRKTLEWILEESTSASAQAGHSMRFLGMEVFDGRSCFVFERHRPRDMRHDEQTDCLLRIYIDREWLVPIATYFYADEAGTNLLGSYVSRSVEFNIGLGDDDFAVGAKVGTVEASNGVWPADAPFKDCTTPGTLKATTSAGIPE
jgi:hypothetical protein